MATAQDLIRGKRQSLFEMYRQHVRWGSWMLIFYRCLAGASAGGALGSFLRGEGWFGQVFLAGMAVMFLCFNRFFIGKFIAECEDGMRKETLRALGGEP